MINWGIQPFVVDRPESTDEMFRVAGEKAKELGFAQAGDLIIVVAGTPGGNAGTTNLMRVLQVK